jgi:hypothetical protein
MSDYEHSVVIVLQDGQLSVFHFFSEGLLSYSMPQGVQRGTEVDLSDRTYDGREESGYLSSGLGQLVDGQKGQDIFRLDLMGHGKGNFFSRVLDNKDIFFKICESYVPHSTQNFTGTISVPLRMVDVCKNIITVNVRSFV